MLAGLGPNLPTAHGGTDGAFSTAVTGRPRDRDTAPHHHRKRCPVDVTVGRRADRTPGRPTTTGTLARKFGGGGLPPGVAEVDDPQHVVPGPEPVADAVVQAAALLRLVRVS